MNVQHRLCNGCLFYLMFLTTFFVDQFSQASNSDSNKRHKKKDYPFMSSHYQYSKYDLRQFSSVHKYKVRLYSKGSEAYIRIISRRRIDGLGQMESADSVLVIESVAFGVIRIRGFLNGLYLCINKKGHLVARRTPRSPRCAFIVEDDHPLAYKRYVSLANPSYRIAFNKNGRPRTATRVPNRNHRSVLFVERRLTNGSLNVQSRTRRHGLDSSINAESFLKDPCRKSNRILLSRDWVKPWTAYCQKKKVVKQKSSLSPVAPSR